jgi:23S rRNA (cytosine1962-C5)-methyltransferase
LFPEQVGNWAWIADQVRRCRERRPAGRARVLNLFAYTGGASLAAAIAGAEVTHVDSSGPTVGLAKRNAEASGVADLPIRWLVEDAMKFVARECRRGNTYDGIIVDPPTYGHGPKGQPFKFKQHLEALLAACGELLGPAPADVAITPAAQRGGFLLFSCHAPGFGPADAVTAVSSVLSGADASQVDGKHLVLESADGRTLDAGVAARWSAFSD